MAYYSMGAYTADVQISAFTGLYQYGDGMNGDVRYAVDEQNAETPAGVLQPQAAPEILQNGFTTKIETLARLYRRWHTGVNEEREILFAATNGRLYYRHLLTDENWTQLAFPAGVTAYQSNVWSWVAYEINPTGSTAPVDVLLMSNAKDGMILIRGDNFTVTRVNTQGYKFGVIARYAERIWGGALPDDPDTLVYSAPYDPENWEANATSPEDGAGDINQPSWDGDSFTALRAFGSQLIAFKKNRVWRVLGVDPGEYVFKEQYGGGAPFTETIAVDVERIFLAEKDGLSVYDGLAVDNFRRQEIEKFWKTVNPDAMNQMCGALFQKKYYLAVPTGTSAVNNELIVLNLTDGTILRYTGIYIESFLATEDFLLATSSTLPGQVMKLNWDSWETGTASGQAVRWVTPWMDFNSRKVQKGGFDLYFTPEVQSQPVTLTFSIQTEKKIKTKKYTVQPLTSVERLNNKNYKQKKLHFGGTGRRFRLIIESPAGSTAPWRLIGGIQMVVETDPD